MMMREPVGVDTIYGELLRAGEATPDRLAEIFRPLEPDEDLVVSLLRRALPVRALEYLARTPPWPDRPRVLEAIVLNPKTPPRVALPLVDGLAWHSLADVAASPRVPMAVRLRAEATLKDQLPALRVGDRITLGRIATPAVLMVLLTETDLRILETGLQNPRLRESDLLVLLRKADCRPELIEAIALSSRWRESYAVRLAIALQARCPLGIALAQLSSLIDRDLVRVGETATLAPLVRAAAQRVREDRAEGGAQKKLQNRD